MKPRKGLFHCDQMGCHVWRPSLRENHPPCATSLSIRIMSPYARSTSAWLNRLGNTRLSVMSPAASCIQRNAAA